MTEKVDFTALNIKICELFSKYPIEKQREIYEYLSGLDDLQLRAYDIAYDHLGLSFDIERSNG